MFQGRNAAVGIYPYFGRDHLLLVCLVFYNLVQYEDKQRLLGIGVVGELSDPDPSFGILVNLIVEEQIIH